MNKDSLYFRNKINTSNLPSGAVNVYKELLSYANRKTWSCFPSVKTLSKGLHLSERNIRKQLSILEEEGYILRIPRKRNDNGNTSNIYFFN